LLIGREFEECLRREAAVAIGPDPRAAVTAFNRFGLGAKPGDLALAASDPRGFLLEELWTQGAALIGNADLPATPKALQQLFLDQQQRRIERERAAMTRPPVAQPPGLDATGGVANAPEQKPKPQEPNIAQKLFRNEAVARFAKGPRRAPALSSGSSPFGQIILPSPPQKAGSYASPPGRSSARRSGRMCAENSRTS
jgi:uncharacterized protein (DUF1800 family)